MENLNPIFKNIIESQLMTLPKNNNKMEITTKNASNFYEKELFDPEDMDNNFNDHCLIMQQFANHCINEYKESLKKAFSEYVRTEGCSCCEDVEGHKKASDKLGVMLNFKKYDDDSGYDFYDSSS